MNTQEGSTPRSRLKARKGRRSTFFKLSGGHDSAVIHENGSEIITNSIGDLGHPSRVAVANNENLNSDEATNQQETGDKKSIQQEFQLNQNFSDGNNNKRKLDSDEDNSPDMEQVEYQSSKRKKIIQQRIVSNDVGSALADLDNEDSEQELEDARGINSIQYGETHSVIKNRNLDKVKDDFNSKSGRRIDLDSIGKDPNSNLLELQRLKSLNENLLVKYSVLVEEQKQNGFGNVDESRLEELAKFKLKCRDLTVELNKLKEEYRKAKEDNNKAGGSSISTEIINSLETKVGDLIDKNKRLDAIVVELTNERNLYKEESENQQYQKDALVRSKNEFELKLKEAEQLLEDNIKMLKQKEDKIDDMNIDNESLKSEVKTYKNNYERASKQIEELKNETSKSSKFEGLLKIKDQTIDDLKDKVEDLEIDLKRLNSFINTNKDKMNSEIEKLSNELKENKDKLKVKTNEINELKIKYSELELESKFKISKLEQLLENEKSKVIEDEGYVLKLKDQIKNFNSKSYELDQLRSDNDSLKSRLEKVTSNLSDSKNENLKLESEVYSLKEDLQRMKTKELLFKEPLVDNAELKELKLENQELRNELELANKKNGNYSKNLYQDIEILEDKLAHSTNKLNQSVKECMQLEDDLSNVIEERNLLKKKLEKIDYQTSEKVESLIEENNSLKLDMNKFSKTALKYQNESSQLKTELNMMHKKLKTFDKNSIAMERQLQAMKEKKDYEVNKVKKQYIQELRNLQEENLSLTENLNIFKNSLGSQSRKYGSGTQERDIMIKNLQDQLKFFKNKYEGEVDKNRDLQTMNEHYRKLVNQSTKELRLGRLQNPSYIQTRTMDGFDDLGEYTNMRDTSKKDRYRYTSYEFNF